MGKFSMFHPSRLRRNPKTTCQFIAMLVTSFIFVILCIGDSYTWHAYTRKPRSAFVTTFNQNNITDQTSSTLVIQYVTPFFNSWAQRQSVIRDWKNRKIECPKRCEFTMGKSINSTSDVLVFHSYGLHKHPESITAHARRNQNQMWILENAESPWKTWLDVRRYNGMFNLTRTVRSDSDIPAPYDRITHHVTSRSLKVKVKPKHAYWMVSNCWSINHREAYVDSLRKYYPVDIYSECACEPDAYVCPRGSKKCDNLAEQYKFYLAFENANCRDYVTEKFWRSLRTGVVPVVMGDSEAYRKIAPPGSYIDVADFRSPEELARYLHQVGSNITLYRNYFSWRSSYIVDSTGSCDLCESLHKHRGIRQVYHDLEGWYLQDHCIFPNFVGLTYIYLINSWKCVCRMLKSVFHRLCVI